jgi:hypothetical protein
MKLVVTRWRDEIERCLSVKFGLHHHCRAKQLMQRAEQ